MNADPTDAVPKSLHRDDRGWRGLVLPTCQVWNGSAEPDFVPFARRNSFRVSLGSGSGCPCIKGTDSWHRLHPQPAADRPLA